TLDERFHRAIVAVAHPSGDLVDERRLHGRVPITHAMHATMDDQPHSDDAHRLRNHAKSAATVLPSVTPPLSNVASSSSSVIVTTSINSPASRRAPTWARPAASKSSM